MADIFLSYSRADRPRAELIAKSLEAEGLTVWWDKILKAGQTYDEVTEGMLRDAKVVVVLWSEVSVKSKWVRTEATLGERTSTIVPAMIDDAERPIMFELTQSADLIGWAGDRTEERWKGFIEDIKSAISARVPAPDEASPATPAPTQDDTIEHTFWTSIQGSGDVSDYEAYLKRYPSGHFSDLANNRIAALTPATSIAAPPVPEPPAPEPEIAPTSPPPAPEPVKAAKGSSKLPAFAGIGAVVAIALVGFVVFSGGGDTPDNDAPVGVEMPSGLFSDCEQCPTMVSIPAGSFMMGSPDDEAGRTGNEGPLHEVTLRAFAIGKTEVTTDQWQACVNDGGCSYTPSDRGFGGGGMPVLDVSWQDANTYADWLSRKSGRRYRLPSEAEWEYAARGGTSTPYWWGTSFDPLIAPTSAPVQADSLPANPFGVKGMLGNAREWVQDCYINSYLTAPTNGAPQKAGDCTRRVLRGGAWGRDPDDHRAANRARIDRNTRDKVFGFRLATSELPED